MQCWPGKETYTTDACSADASRCCAEGCAPKTFERGSLVNEWPLDGPVMGPNAGKTYCEASDWLLQPPGDDVDCGVSVQGDGTCQDACDNDACYMVIAT